MKNECLLQFYMENIDQNHSKCLVNLKYEIHIEAFYKQQPLKVQLTLVH